MIGEYNEPLDLGVHDFYEKTKWTIVSNAHRQESLTARLLSRLGHLEYSVTLHSWDNDVVVRVSVILDQGTAVVVASELNSVRVDGVDRGQESFTFVDNDGSVGVNSGSGDLRVDMGANLHVTSDHRKFNSVGVQGSVNLNVVVHVVVHVGVGVVSIVVGFLMDIRDQVVMGVAIIGDESATMIVAGDLELVGGDLVHRGSIGLAVNLDSDSLVVKGSGGQLRVGVGVHIDVSSVDVELHTVSAHGLWLVVMVVHVVMHVRVVVHVVMHVVVHVIVHVGVLVHADIDVVMRIAIIGDQSATGVIASELESMRIDFVHRGDVGVSVDLNGNLSWGDGGSSVLGVGVGTDRDVASSHMELHTVGAQGLVLIVTVVVVSVMILLVVGVVVVLTVLVGMMLVGSWERVSERQLSLSAGKDGSARSDHLGGKSKLLAVQDQGVLVVVKVVLGIGASILSSVHAGD